ncbi:MAG: complex I NDUFA9 subunit family protein [Gammaproteobacteria bacterium]|nr:complex I NDUFA9 subunit family protein [Gammaproteobacteria bacterium]
MSTLHRVCILGGSGFVGHHIIAQLASHKHHVKVLTRNRERHRDLLVLPTVVVNNANVHDPITLKEEFAGYDVVINLVGVLNEEGQKDRSFQGAHVELARKVMEACRVNRIKRLLHMSALNADAGRGSSRYLRSKGEAENLLHTTKEINVTSFRPSVIFGPEDSFLNRFAGLLKITPKVVPFPLACPNSRFAPVYVEDVAKAFVNAIDNKAAYGKHYNLCGPKEYTLKELVQYTGELIGEKRMILGLSQSLSKLQAIIFSMVPGKPFTFDNYLSLLQDSICKEPFPQEFGFTPTALEAIAPYYLANKQSRARLDIARKAARRDA